MFKLLISLLYIVYTIDSSCGSTTDIAWVYGDNKLVLNILELITPLTKQQTKFSNCLNVDMKTMMDSLWSETRIVEKCGRGRVERRLA